MSRIVLVALLAILSLAQITTWACAANDSTPVVLEKIIRLDNAGDQLLGLNRVTIPIDKSGDALVFTCDGKEIVGVGGQLAIHGKSDLKSVRFVLNTNDLNSFQDFRLEPLMLGKVGNTPYAWRVSLRFPADSRPRIFTDPAFQITKPSHGVSWWAVTEYSGFWNDLALNQFRIGPELKWERRGIATKLRYTVGAGDPQWQILLTAPLGK